MAANHPIITALILTAAAAALPGSGPAPAALLAGSALATSAQALTWSPDLFGTFSHSGALQAAAAYAGDGFTDWRLPTLEELQAAVTDADPDTFGPTDNPNTTLLYWSSKKQGSAWAFAVEVVTRADGYPDPARSGRVVKTPRRSALLVRCVRP